MARTCPLFFLLAGKVMLSVITILPSKQSTLDFHSLCMCVGHDCSSPGIASKGHKSGVRVRVSNNDNDLCLSANGPYARMSRNPAKRLNQSRFRFAEMQDRLAWAQGTMYSTHWHHLVNTIDRSQRRRRGLQGTAITVWGRSF